MGKFLIPVFFVSVMVGTLLANQTIRLSSDRNSFEIQLPGHKKTIPLNLPPGMPLEGELFYYQLNDFHLVVGVAAAHDTATSLLYALNGQGQLLWFKDFEVFNPSIPLIEDGFVYMAGFDKIAKLDKLSGREIWVREGLFDDLTIRFNGGEEIKREGSNIRFSDRLLVEDSTGNIVR
jgi:outer membrane protein assembly factor BamB